MLSPSTTRRTPEVLEVYVAPPEQNAIHGNLRDDAIVQWQARNRGNLYMLVENQGTHQLDLGFFASSDNGNETPYAPVEWRVNGTLSTAANVVRGGIAEIVAPPTYAVAASGRVTLDDQPSDGDTVTLQDHSGTSETFEFDNNNSVGGGNITVTIGADVVATRTNLIDAINNQSFNIVAQAHMGDDSQIRNFGTFPRGVVSLYQETVGSAGNNAITVSGSDISATGFTNGSDSTALDWFTFRALNNPDVAVGRLRIAHYQGVLVPHFSVAEESL